MQRNLEIVKIFMLLLPRQPVALLLSTFRAVCHIYLQHLYVKVDPLASCIITGSKRYSSKRGLELLCTYAFVSDNQHLLQKSKETFRI